MAAALLFSMVFFVSLAGTLFPHLSLRTGSLTGDRYLGRGSLVQIIMFSDLECDYINPIDLCNKLNAVSPNFVLSIYREPA